MIEVVVADDVIVEGVWRLALCLVVYGSAAHRTTRVYPCEDIHKSIIGLLPREHAKSQHLIT